MVVALPATAIDGRPLETAEAAPLERLRKEARAAGAEIEFVFADTLDAVEPALGPFAMREIVTPARALGAFAALIAIAVVVGAWLSWLHAPIALAFEPVGPATRGLVDDAAPQRARYDAAADKLQLLGPCFDDQRQPMVVGGETLVLRVSARDGLPYASALRPPRLFIASVSRAADPVILDAEHFRSLAPSPQGERRDRPHRGDPDRADRGRSAAVRRRHPRPVAGDHRPAGRSAQDAQGSHRRGGVDDDDQLPRRPRRRRNQLPVQGDQ